MVAVISISDINHMTSIAGPCLQCTDCSPFDRDLHRCSMPFFASVCLRQLQTAPDAHF